MEELLERGVELDELEALVNALGRGGGRLVLLAGEAGIGKTSVVRALRERVGGRAQFLLGACEPLSVPVPLGPLRELLEWAGAPDIEGGDRLVLARAVLDALRQRAPAVAVIEDIHWADPSTLDVIQLLARRLESDQVAVIATYRDDEVAANPDLARVLGAVVKNPAVQRIALAPLSEQAVRKLAEPAGVDPAKLAQVTGGNPFLVVESVHAQDRPPASVKDAVLARAGRLSAFARQAVDAAAVIGQRFDPALLEAVSPGSASSVEEALARGVMVADSAVLGFRHELIREAIESAIAPPRRTELHGRVVRALEQTPGLADAARLAHHAELAGLRDQACQYAEQAASEAERMGATREAHLQLSRALRLGTELDRVDRFELLIRCSKAANFASSRLEDSLEPAEEAVALADGLGDPVRRSRALIPVAWANWSLDRLDAAKDAATQAVAALEDSDELADLARAHSTLIRIDASAFDPAAAVEAGSRALELADRAGLEETKIDITISLGLARGHLGEAAALADLETVCEAARAAQLAIPTVRSYVNQVFVAMLLRDHAFVDRKASEALEVFEGYQTTIPGYAIETYLARSLLDRGRWDEVLAIACRSDRDWVSETPVVLTLRGLIASRRGELDAAPLLDEAWRELGQVPAGSRHGLVRVARVEAAWLAGDHAGVRGQLLDALESPAAHRFARHAAELALWGSRSGIEFPLPPRAPAPIEFELEGDWRRAVKAWRELEAPYEAALAALPGNDRAARDALATLHKLGARGAGRAFVRERAARGARAPRGPRRTTLANPAGLTRREQEVLERVATGATNAAIADELCLSQRTVAHHVSSILSKLGAVNRLAAVEQARAQGVLGQDGQLERQT